MSIIDKPSHYCFGEYEPRKVIHDWNLNFNLGNVIKYVARAGKKEGNSTLQDLKKARQYIEFEIEELEKEQKKPTRSGNGVYAHVGPFQSES